MDDDDGDDFASEVLRAAHPELDDFLATMHEQGFTLDEQRFAVRLVLGVQGGSYNQGGYRMARDLDPGLSSAEANANRATSVVLDIGDYLGPDAPEQARRRFIL